MRRFAGLALGLAAGDFGLVLPLFGLEAGLSPGVDLGLGVGQQGLDFLPQLRFQLFNVTPRQGLVLGCVGLELAAVQADLAKLEQLHGLRDR